MIQVENLSKRFGDVVAIRDLNFTINAGDVLGFLGPNGAGKSTTMKIITCLMPPSQGRVQVKGMDSQTHSMEIRRLIGYLPENNPLYGDMTPLEYLDFVGKLRQMDRSNRQNRIRTVIEQCGLGDMVGKPIEVLSKGYRQRVGLAQALLHQPEILILDEPTSGLDPKQIIGIRNLIKEVGQSATVILCSHILSEVAATSSRVFILNKGQIVADGSPETLMQQREGGGFVYVELDQNIKTIRPILDGFDGVQDVEKLGTDKGYSRYKITCQSDIREAVFQAAVDHNWRVRELTRDETSLEDIFLALTGDPA